MSGQAPEKIANNHGVARMDILAVLASFPSMSNLRIREEGCQDRQDSQPVIAGSLPPAEAVFARGRRFRRQLAEVFGSDEPTIVITRSGRRWSGRLTFAGRSYHVLGDSPVDVADQLTVSLAGTYAT